MNRGGVEIFSELVTTYYPLPADRDAKDGIESCPGVTLQSRGRRCGVRLSDRFSGEAETPRSSFEVVSITPLGVIKKLRELQWSAFVDESNRDLIDYRDSRGSS